MSTHSSDSQGSANGAGHSASSTANPPSFEEARNRRQKARAAGLDPDYWYPVEHDDKLRRGQTIEVTFWKRSIALYRGQDNRVRAIENRCAHRQLKLTLGKVDGCHLVCPYHGWEYDESGRVVRIPHELFGKPMPNISVGSYPVQVRYGLIWIFPGDPELATKRTIPEIPELECADHSERWGVVPIDRTWKAHHSMILDNVSDFTHAYLHRSSRPFVDAKLLRCEPDADRVTVEYDTVIGDGAVTKHFIDRKAVDVSHIELCYDYPYQRSNTDGGIKHWCFVLPIDERTSRAFFLFYFKGFKVPFLPLRFPYWLMKPILAISKVLAVKPIIDEDGVAVEAEQEGYQRHFDSTIAELNPAVHEFQKLTIRKWEAHLAKQAAQRAAAAAALRDEARAGAAAGCAATLPSSGSSSSHDRAAASAAPHKD